MSKKIILTLSDDVDQYIKEQSKNLGLTKIDYIRFIINKDRESKK
jgi:predicted DNA-binding protein